MKRVLKWTAIVLAVVLVAIQFVPVDRTNPPPGQTIAAPPEVQAILKRACFDCHSNETHWPWYSYIAPVSWLVAHDVEDGRKHLNLSIWGDMPKAKRDSKAIEMYEEVESGEMPLKAYVLLHSEAKLSPADVALLKAWSDEL
ncbi:MAG: heme-binding domain-containing protein [Planctomycetes bacterium]|nr:heme-binding domain-containing protein [Planctomycetota bacterium]